MMKRTKTLKVSKDKNSGRVTCRQVVVDGGYDTDFVVGSFSFEPGEDFEFYQVELQQLSEKRLSLFGSTKGEFKKSVEAVVAFLQTALAEVDNLP